MCQGVSISASLLSSLACGASGVGLILPSIGSGTVIAFALRLRWGERRLGRVRVNLAQSAGLRRSDDGRSRAEWRGRRTIPRRWSRMSRP
ncbi:hypothetical protein C8J57DRAFT_1404086, partial [Mycena rebaudengoi]